MALRTVPLGSAVAFAADRDPTATDDADTIGARFGLLWGRTDTGKWWVCRDATPGAAVWDTLN